MPQLKSSIVIDYNTPKMEIIILNLFSDKLHITDELKYSFFTTCYIAPKTLVTKVTAFSFVELYLHYNIKLSANSYIVGRILEIEDICLNLFSL